MGLDQDLFITKHFVWAHNHPDPTTVDGFELHSQKMTVVEWRKNHWVHQWFCANVSEALPHLRYGAGRCRPWRSISPRTPVLPSGLRSRDVSASTAPS